MYDLGFINNSFHKSYFVNHKSFLLALLTFVLLFILRLQFLPKLNLKDGELIKVKGVLSREPQTFKNRQSFKIGQIEVWTQMYPEYHYGQRLQATGKVKKQSAGWRLFAADKYLLSYPEIEVVSASEDLAGPAKTALALKRRFKDLYNRSLPKPMDGIMTGITLGDKSLIPADFWEQMRRTGTLHIMVASGMNIALIAGSALSVLTLFFRRKQAIIFLLGLIWFYSILIGFSAPIVRAAIMASLTYLAQLVGREAEAKRGLWLTGLLMLFIRPGLVWDIGFQLSFMATLGLVYLQPVLSRSGFFLLRFESFASSLAAQIMTLPILAVNFGAVNLVSPLINLAVLWTIPLLLEAGMAAGLLGLVWHKLGGIVLLVFYPLLWWIWQTISLSARISMFEIEISGIWGWGWALYYMALAFWIKKAKSGVSHV